MKFGNGKLLNYSQTKPDGQEYIVNIFARKLCF